jgi:hypothetical protein
MVWKLTPTVAVHRFTKLNIKVFVRFGIVWNKTRFGAVWPEMFCKCLEQCDLKCFGKCLEQCDLKCFAKATKLLQKMTQYWAVLKRTICVECFWHLLKTGQKKTLYFFKYVTYLHFSQMWKFRPLLVSLQNVKVVQMHALRLQCRLFMYSLRVYKTIRIIA